jgi:hypothetical protein
MRPPITTGCNDTPIRTKASTPRSKRLPGRKAESVPSGRATSRSRRAPPTTTEIVIGAAARISSLTFLSFLVSNPT